MPRTYRPSTKKPYKRYNELAIKAALSDYKNNKCALSEIAKKHGISKSVLYRHNTRIMKKHGGQTVISSEVENYLVGILNHCSEWGYALDTYDLRLLVKSYLDRFGVIVKRFHDNLPGPDFVKAFLQRHKSKLSVKICRKRIKSRTAVSPEIIEEYFKELDQRIITDTELSGATDLVAEYTKQESDDNFDQNECTDTELCCATEPVEDCTRQSNGDSLDQRGICTETERFNTLDPLEDNTTQSNDDNSDENDFDYTNIDYLEEDADFDSSDDTNNINDYEDQLYIKQEDTAAPTKPKFKQDLKPLDDIDHLFLSYAHTFRTLAKQSQTMLKLEMAQLFAHYEMENTSLSSHERNEPVKPLPVVAKPSTLDTPATVKSQPVVGKPYAEKTSVFIPSKEKTKRVFPRVNLRKVIPEITNPETVQSSTKSIRPQVKRLQKIRLQKKQSAELGVNTVPKSTLFENVTKSIEPTVKLKRLKRNLHKMSSPLQSTTLLPPEKLKKLPDLEMEVSEPIYNETVFITDDNLIKDVTSM